MIHVKHILVKQQYEMDDLLKKIDEGMSFEEVAKKFSICPSSRSGGDLGFISKGQTVEEFEKIAFTLEIGDVSKSLRTSFGFHIIMRVE